MLRPLLLLAAFALAAPVLAQTDDWAPADSLVDAAYQTVLDGPAFSFRFEMRFESPDTVFTLAGTATTYAAPPDGVTWHRLDYDAGETTAEAFNGDAFFAMWPRTRRVYVDSTAQAMTEGLGVFLRLHPALGMGLYNLHTGAFAVEGPAETQVGGRPCLDVAVRLGTASGSDEMAVCFDRATQLPSRVRVNVPADSARFEMLYSPAEAIEIPAPEVFALALPEGYAYASYDWSTQPRLAVGHPAPDFALSGEAGETVRLSDYRGRVVLLDFWGTWCAPCVATLPKVSALANAHPDLVVLGLASHEEADADPAAFARTHGATYPILRATSEVVDLFLVRAFPTYYVVGPDGTVLFEGTHDDDETTEGRLDAFLRSLFALRAP